MDAKDKIEWRIEFSCRVKDGNNCDVYTFCKYVNDKIEESYIPVNKDKAVLFFDSIINGFNPPKL